MTARLRVVPRERTPVHIAREDDEFDAVCGEPSPEVLLEAGPGGRAPAMMPMYVLCEACERLIGDSSGR